MPFNAKPTTRKMQITVGPFENEEQKGAVISAVLGVTDAHIGKERKGDKPLTVTDTRVQMSCTETGRVVRVELEGPDTQIAKARRKIEDSVKPFGVKILLNIHQERKK